MKQPLRELLPESLPVLARVGVVLHAQRKTGRMIRSSPANNPTHHAMTPPALRQPPKKPIKRDGLAFARRQADRLGHFTGFIFYVSGAYALVACCCMLFAPALIGDEFVRFSWVFAAVGVGGWAVYVVSSSIGRGGPPSSPNAWSDTMPVRR